MAFAASFPASNDRMSAAEIAEVSQDESLWLAARNAMMEQYREVGEPDYDYATTKEHTYETEFDLPSLDQPFHSANENDPPPANMQHFSCVGIAESGRSDYKLKLIFRNGNRRSFPYAYISEVAFDVEGRFTILTSEREIIIEGRGLDNLEEWIFESRVKWLKEDNRSFDPHEEGVFVGRIEVRGRRGEELACFSFQALVLIISNLNLECAIFPL